MKHKTITVVGAGIAGLVAAYDLQKAGCDVKVLEKSTWAGGRMANLQQGRMVLETGASYIFNFYRAMMDLIKELGIENTLIEVPYHSVRVVSPDGAHTFSYGGNALKLLFNPALSFRSKCRLPVVLLELLRARFNIDPDLMETVAGYDDVDMETYLTRKVGRDFVDGFVAPLFRTLWAWEPHEFSRGYFLAFLAHTMWCRTYTFANGIGFLTKTLAEQVNVHLNAEVRNIRKDGDGWTVSYKENEIEKSIYNDIVICACEAFHLSKLIDDLAPEQQKFFDEVRYSQAMGLHYLLKGELEPKFTAYSQDYPGPLGSISQIPSGLSGLVDSPARLWVTLRPAYVKKNVSEHGEILDELTRPHVKKLYPNLDDDLLEVHTQYEGLHLSLVYPGYIKKARDFLKEQEQNNRGIYFCGDYLGHPHSGGACATGRRVARQIMNK